MLWLAPLLVLFVMLDRWLFQRLVNSIQGVKPALRNTLVIGSGVMGQNLISELSLRPSVYHVVGLLDDNKEITGYMDIRNLGGLDSLRDVILEHHIHDVFIAISTAREELIKKIIDVCEEMLNLDLAYISNWSFENDIRILLKTIPVVLFGKAY